MIPVLLCALGCFAAAPKVWLTYRWKRLAGPVTQNPPPLPTPKAATPRWVWLLVVVIFGACLYSLNEGQKPKGQPEPAKSTKLWLAMACLGSVVLIVLGTLLARNRDPVSKRAYRRGLDGDVAGAIDELHREILDQGPTGDRINTLVVLMLKHEDYQAATEWARKGLALAPDLDFLRSNFALALLKTGQAAEAQAVYAELASRENAHFVFALNHADALTQLGRLDEAENQLQVAEAKLRGTFYVGGRGTRAQVRTSIAEGRAKIAAARGAKDATGLFPDL